MKHNNIAKTLGWAGVEDLTEGLHLQPEEAAVIDTALGNAEAGAQAAADLLTANNTIAARDATITTMQATIDGHVAKEATQNTRIQELEGEVVELGKESSGTGTVLTVKEDAAVEPPKTIGLNSPEHPLNQFATRKLSLQKMKQAI
jgi:hypothetical protein